MSDSNIVPSSSSSSTATTVTATTGTVGKKAPADFLRTVIGRPVSVRLTTGVDYRGKYPQVVLSTVFKRLYREIN